MARDQDKLIRQLSLLAFLLSRSRPCTAREIHESVEGYGEMSEDTFTRRFYADRADLARIGIRVKVLDCDEGQELSETKLYYLPEDEFYLPAVEFTPEEARAMGVALAALDGRFAYSRPLRLALTAILQGQEYRTLDDFEHLPVAVAPDDDAYQVGEQLARLEEALTRGKTITFPYRHSDGSTSIRTLDPYSLFHIQGHWYVVGHDHLRNDIRSFRVGRIVGTVSFLTEKPRDFLVPQDYDPNKYRARPPWLLGPVQGTAIIRLDEDLAWLVERIKPHVTQVGEDEEGQVYFSVPYANEKAFLSWVVGLGSGDALSEPATLRSRLYRLLMEVARLHGEISPPPAAASTPEPTSERPPLSQENSEELLRSRQRASTPSNQPSRSTPTQAAPIAPERLARALVLLSYLLDQKRPALVPWEDLQKDLGLSRKEVEADLKVINLVNFGGGTYALTAETEPDGVRVIRDVMADAFSRPARLSPVMARALLLALELLGQALPLAGLASLARVRDKIEATIGADPGDSVKIEDLIPPDSSVVTALSQAIQHNRVVELHYYHPVQRELVARTVEPYLLFHSPHGWYLESYCLSAQGQRTFKLERIQQVRVTDTVFTRRPEMDLSPRRIGRPFDPAQAVTWVRVLFRPELRRYVEDHTSGYMVRQDGWLETRLPCASEEWLALEVIRHLGDAIVEAPISARTKVSELALALAARYAAPSRRVPRVPKDKAAEDKA